MSVPLAHRNRVRDDVLQIAEHLRTSLDAPVMLLCHDHRDIPFAATFQEIPYLFTDDVYEYLSLLRAARVCVAYRLHAALPCLSMGTPVVKISYDERGNSTMDTVGLGEWNINMVEDGPVVENVVDRLRRLDQLTAACDAARPGWDELLEGQRSALSEFASLVSG